MSVVSIPSRHSDWAFLLVGWLSICHLVDGVRERARKMNFIVKSLGERKIRDKHYDGYFGLFSSCRYVTLRILLTSVHF